MCPPQNIFIGYVGLFKQVTAIQTNALFFFFAVWCPVAALGAIFPRWIVWNVIVDLFLLLAVVAQTSRCAAHRFAAFPALKFWIPTVVQV